MAATLNRPLVPGDELWLDHNARAELDLGHAFVRVDEETNIGILGLDDDSVQIRIAGGTAQVHLRRLDQDDQFEIDTPQAALSLLRAGEYRVNVNADGQEADAIVRAGELEVTAPGQAFPVHAGQQARIYGLDTVRYEVTAASPPDEFDAFCQMRDRRAERAESLQHVSPYVIGWEDLDEYGDWMDSPPYGPVWVPRSVVAGWAPYRFGHWVWIEPWGWTWIDDAPWGFAPFHYGRWLTIGVNWCWVPGPVHIRAVYAPALVVFAGGGPGFRYYFGIGGGVGVAWFPLGPREIYVPPYRASRVYVTNINVSHTVVMNRGNIWKVDPERQHYMNRTDRAFTAVPQDVFAGGRPVGRAAVHVNREQAESARIGGSAPPVAPSRGSVAPMRESGPPASRPPDAVSRRQVTVRRSPAPPAVPFERKQPELERNPGRPPDSGKVGELRRQQPQAPPQYRQVPAQPQTQPQTQAPARRQQPSGNQAPGVRAPNPNASGGRSQAPAGRAPAQAPSGRAPQNSPPARQPTPSQVENRRRSIDQERQRVETAPRKGPQQPSRQR